MIPIVTLAQFGDDFTVHLSEDALYPGLCRDLAGVVIDSEADHRSRLGISIGRSPPASLEDREVRRDAEVARWALLAAIRHWEVHSAAPGETSDESFARRLELMWEYWAYRDPTLARETAWWLARVHSTRPDKLDRVLDSRLSASDMALAVACNLRAPPSSLRGLARQAPPTEPYATLRAGVWAWSDGDRDVAASLVAKAVPELRRYPGCLNDVTVPAPPGARAISRQDQCNQHLEIADYWLLAMEDAGAVQLDPSDWRTLPAQRAWTCRQLAAKQCSWSATWADDEWSTSDHGTCSPEFEACAEGAIAGVRPTVGSARVHLW